MRIVVALILAISMLAGAADVFAADAGSPREKAEKIYRKAIAAYGSANYSDAISFSTEALKEDPAFAQGYMLRGKANKDMGDLDKAMKDLDQAIKLDPKLGEAYFIRAQTYDIMGDMAKAKADYKSGCANGYKQACE